VTDEEDFIQFGFGQTGRTGSDQVNPLNNLEN
jgi:hypothetical protein